MACVDEIVEVVSRFHLPRTFLDVTSWKGTSITNDFALCLTALSLPRL
jgi:hypothetical protein